MTRSGADFKQIQDWKGLPEVIEDEILSYLTITDLACASRVSKSWLSILRPKLPRALHTGDAKQEGIERDENEQKKIERKAILPLAIKKNDSNFIRDYLYFRIQHKYKLIIVPQKTKPTLAANQIGIKLNNKGSINYYYIHPIYRDSRKNNITAKTLKKRLSSYDAFCKAIQNNDEKALNTYLIDIILMADNSLNPLKEDFHLKGDIKLDNELNKSLYNPTLLSLAASYGRGDDGIKMIALFLAHNAPILIDSFPISHNPTNPDLISQNLLPLSGLARDPTVKIFLLLAEFEERVLSCKFEFAHLDQALKIRPKFTRDYIYRFTDPSTDSFQGVYKTLEKSKIDRIRSDRFFKYYKAEYHGESFWKKHSYTLKRLLIITCFATLAITVACFHVIVPIGAAITSAFTSATVSANIQAIVAGLGLELLGLISCVAALRVLDMVKEYNDRKIESEDKQGDLPSVSQLHPSLRPPKQQALVMGLFKHKVAAQKQKTSSPPTSDRSLSPAAL